MTRPIVAALITLALVGCKREEAILHPELIIDPHRIDLVNDTPFDVPLSAVVVIANVGQVRTTLTEVELRGEHADLVAFESPVGTTLEPGAVVSVPIEVVGSLAPSESPFYEELELLVTGDDANADDPPTASAAVAIGMLWACDADADGFVAAGCGGDDCDDVAADVNPAMDERCNTIDDDCDGDVDEPDAIDAPVWFADVDADGFGDVGAQRPSCERLEGYVDDATDCDDQRVDVNPLGVEVCDDVDQDCDGAIDDDAIDVVPWYADADADAHGSLTVTEIACTQPLGYLPTSDDCDDADATIYPGAVETCDGADDDCDGAIDDTPIDVIVAYADTDGDAHGDKLASLTACAPPPGYVIAGDDCDDRAPDVYPGAPEVCNRRDDDCDSVIDNGSPMRDFYRDGDADGYGDAATAIPECTPPVGFVADNTDCRDAEPTIHPGAAELCDGIDQDCDGVADNGTAGLLAYPDDDLDGFGDTARGLAQCPPPPGYLPVGGDCDDTAATVLPGAPELCDGVDQDCDGVPDDDAVDAKTWFADTDADTYGAAAVTARACTAPAGFVADSTDCNDRTATINPAAPELCDGLDQDCDGTLDNGLPTTTWYADADRDGYGDPSTITAACGRPAGYVADSKDCDDTKASVQPGAPELCDGVDQDCDGAIDDGIPITVYFRDADGDRYGNPALPTSACKAPFGHVVDSTDCNDANARINPGAAELCDGNDQDCDGLIDDNASDAKTWYADADTDSFGNAGVSRIACVRPPGTVLDNRDCNDADATINPSKADVCPTDGVDRNCDGQVRTCDGCHPYEPVDKVGWRKQFDVVYQGRPGSEDQSGFGATTSADGRPAFAVRSVLSAGPRRWDMESRTRCDASGQLFQVESQGRITDPSYGTVAVLATDRPARLVLPAGSTAGSGTVWTFDYALTIDISGLVFTAPTFGRSVDAGLETVTVPAGTYRAWKITSKWTQDGTSYGQPYAERTSEFWYAPGVGLVKERTLDATSGAVVMSKDLRASSGL